MDKLIFDFSNINPQFEKNCIRTILAKVTMGISQMDVSELDVQETEVLERLSSIAISLIDEIKYLEKIELFGFEQNEE